MDFLSGCTCSSGTKKLVAEHRYAPSPRQPIQRAAHYVKRPGAAGTGEYVDMIDAASWIRSLLPDVQRLAGEDRRPRREAAGAFSFESAGHRPEHGRVGDYFAVGVYVQTQLLFRAFITIDLPSGVALIGLFAGSIPAMASICGSGGLMYTDCAVTPPLYGRSLGPQDSETSVSG
jgi:hypothetical protein